MLKDEAGRIEKAKPILFLCGFVDASEGSLSLQTAEKMRGEEKCFT